MPPPLHVSTCWHSHRYEEGRDVVLETRALGFTAFELSHVTTPSQLPRLREAIAESLIDVCSAHQFCPAPMGLSLHDADPASLCAADDSERARAVALTQASLALAAEVRAPVVVLRLGTAMPTLASEKLEAMAAAGTIYGRAYIDEKLRLVTARDTLSEPILQRLRRSLNELLPAARELGIVLAIETRPRYEHAPTERELFTLLDEFAPADLSVWHDFGATQVKANLGFLNHAEFLSRIASRVRGAYIHDVEWPAAPYQQPPVANGVDFTALLKLLPETVPCVLQLAGNQRRQRVLEYRQAWVDGLGIPT